MRRAFSILKRIVMGETNFMVFLSIMVAFTFSILKRIVMGETTGPCIGPCCEVDFQYPQADRDG